jgi:hypothetical protein
MSDSRIEWTEPTWNPVTGRTKISPGCQYCYAEAMARRLQAMGAPGYPNGFELTLHEDRLDQPLGRKKPTVYFACSMADLFHAAVPDAFIKRVLAVAHRTPRHTDPILTKRAERLPGFFASRPPAGQRRAGGDGGGSPVRATAHRPAPPGSGPRPLPVGGTVAGGPGAAESGRDSLGSRRRRIGPGRPTDARGMGAGGAGPVPGGGGGVLLQAVGRLGAGRRPARSEGQWKTTGGAPVGRAARDRRGAAVGGRDRGFQSGWTGSGPRIQSSMRSSGIRS